LRRGATSGAVANKNVEAQIVGHLHRGIREALLILFSVLAVFLLAALVTYESSDPAWSHGTVSETVSNAGGVVGAWFADVFLFLFGYLAYLFPLMVTTVGWLLYRTSKQTNRPFYLPHAMVRSMGFIFTMGSGAGMASLHFSQDNVTFPADSGGLLGTVISESLVSVVSQLGATLFLLAIFVIGFSLFTGISWFRVMDLIGRGVFIVVASGQAWFIQKRTQYQEKQKQQALVKTTEKKIVMQIEPAQPAKRTLKKPKINKAAKVDTSKNSYADRERQLPRLNGGDPMALPQLNLLDQPDAQQQTVDASVLETMARLVEVKLKDFNIVVEVVAVLPGPIITRFEIQPAPGVKGSQIANLSKDLARSLSVISVRVVDVIPGKSVIGLEIPNEVREMVRLVEIFQAKVYDEADSPLTLALGKDISGYPMVADLAKMPHLLVAGTTGSGKSVAVNAMILSLLFNATPEQVRLIMIDPKMLELSIYDGIPHLLTPVVTDMKDAACALRWCVAEMERRYKLMAALGVRNIAGYNKKVKEAQDNGEPILDPLYKLDSIEPQEALITLPFIVVVVDELADMMMVVGKKVEEFIARLAQKARAAGVHLVLATQRPSVDVLTGLIKANIPTRISFQVSSKIDSRTIIDQMGAEQLLGHGDMLYLAPGTGIPTRIHGAFVSDKEVHSVVDDIKARGLPDYNDAILSNSISLDGESQGSSDSEDPEQDALYDQAVAIVTETRKASISGVQRRLKIGYNRAARMIEAMEEAGLIGPPQSNGQREVLAPPPP